MASDPKPYELAYLLSPSLSEGEVALETEKVVNLIEETGGIVLHREPPKNRKLSYPIKKQRSVFFGWINFSAPPTAIASLEKKMKNENLLRYLVVQQGPIVAKTPTLRVIPSRPSPLATQPVPREPEKTEEKLDLEALDKKLEEILGK
jgi:small subunit ribosomal protein S6